MMCYVTGMRIGFYQGDVLKLREDLAELRPTIMPSVPRLFNRFYDVMQSRMKELTGMKKRLADWAVATKLANLEKDGSVTHGLYDRLVFNKFKAILGGRVRKLVTGSAPISKDVLGFLKIAFCCPILEGYGQTETTAAATVTVAEDATSGHVGGPVVCMELKLVDVPEMNYFSTDEIDGKPHPRGEICFRGHNIIPGK